MNNDIQLLPLIGAFAVACAVWLVIQNNRRREMAKALETLTASVNSLAQSVFGLTASVDAAVAEINTEDATEAQLSTLAGVVDNLKASVDAQAVRLDEAVNPTQPPAEPPMPPA